MGPKMAVTEVVSDFERAIWRGGGVEDVFPSVKMYSCCFSLDPGRRVYTS
jgi:hypothetical protein